MAELSPDYFLALEDCRRHHLASKTFSGDLAFKHARRIKALIDEFDCRTMLDYGCGKGKQYEDIDRKIGMPLEEFWGVAVTKFDPAWAPFARPPVGQFDIVICTHALGSIPENDLPEIVDRLYGHASKVLYVGERIGIVKKKVFTNPDVCAIGWTAMQWIDLLSPRQPEGIATVLHLQYQRPERDIVGGFRF